MWRWNDALNILSSVSFTDEMIVVGIPNVNGSRNRDYTPPYMKQDLDESNSDLGVANQFLEFIEKEVIPYINSEYRTTNTKLLAGHSRAGLFVIYSFLEKAELFDGHFAFSPAFWREENLIVEKTKIFLMENDRLNSFLYFNLGDKENPKMTQAFDDMQSVFESSKLKSKQYLFEKALNGNHQTTPIIAIPFAIKAWKNFRRNEPRSM